LISCFGHHRGYHLRKSALRRGYLPGFFDDRMALLVSSFDNRSPWIFTAVLGASWTSIAAAVYLAVPATTFAYAMWGHLLARFPPAVVAPFALLAPCAGSASSALVFGESFPLTRYVGMTLIIAGLAVVFLPAGMTLSIGENRRHRQRDRRGD
jgi:drug/metabolite transporter (DMT)-like permease